jgi:hypothetical protein
MFETSIEICHRIDDAQPRMNGPVGRIFVCHRIAKIRQHAIAKVLGHIAIESFNPLSTGLMIRLKDLPQVFRVELLRYAGRAHYPTFAQNLRVSIFEKWR